MNIRFLFGSFIVAATLLMSHVAKPGLVQQGDQGYELWRVRSQTITEELVKDSNELSRMRRAVLWVRLAQSWWRDDPRKASNWIRNALEIVADVPNKENSVDRRERLTTARLLLQMVAPLDQKLTKGFEAILTTDSELTTDAERAENADGLINAALSLVTQDPKRAAELGELALRFGRPQEIGILLLSLRRRDVKLADNLLMRTLGVARQNPTPELLNSLTQASFPAQKGLGANIGAPPDHLRAELLQLHLLYLNANPINPENRDGICTSVATFVAPVLSEFERLIPHQVAAVRQAISKCQSLSPLAQQLIDDASTNQPLDTVEALLKAAADAKDVKVRTVYEYRAASLAKEKKQYDLAIKILDGMSKESREFMRGSWEAYRWDWAALAAVDHYKHGRLFEMNLVLNAAPAELQVFAKIAFVDRVPAKGQEETLIIQILNDARNGLSRLNIAEGEKYPWYFGVLPLTLKYQPAEASTAFKDAVASLNRAEVSNKAKDQANPLNTTELSKVLPASLLEIDEFAVKEGLASVVSVETRAQLRLEMLNATLQRMRKAQATVGSKHKEE